MRECGTCFNVCTKCSTYALLGSSLVKIMACRLFDATPTKDGLSLITPNVTNVEESWQNQPVSIDEIALKVIICNFPNILSKARWRLHSMAEQPRVIWNLVSVGPTKHGRVWLDQSLNQFQNRTRLCLIRPEHKPVSKSNRLFSPDFLNQIWIGETTKPTPKGGLNQVLVWSNQCDLRQRRLFEWLRCLTDCGLFY